MKKLFVFLSAVVLIFGCATFTSVPAPELSAEYYITNEDGYTDPAGFTEDIAWVIETERDGTVDVELVWIDKRHFILAPKMIYNGEEVCAILWVNDIEKALTEDFAEVGLIRPPMQVDCSVFMENLERQLSEEGHRMVDKMHEDGTIQ